MAKFLTKIISLILVLNLFLGRGVILLPAVYGQVVPPQAPSAPSAPSGNFTPPAPPDNPPSPPSVPNTPVLPSPPDAATYVPPTSAALPTSPPPPTSGQLQVEPTGEALPTGETLPTGTSSDGLTNPASSDGGGGVSTSSAGGSSDSGSSSSVSVNDPANTYTGPGSNNAAYEKLNSEMETLNKNLAELQNKIDAVSTTGFNYANLNTLDGNVFSGDALSELNLLNKLNSNITGIGGFSVFNIYDTYIGDIQFQLADDGIAGSFNTASGTVSQNAITGPGSTNIASSENNFQVKEANGNDATIDNDINLAAVSGNNTASYNTGNGVVQTGDANAIGNIINLANTNLSVSQWLFGVVNIWGQLIGDIILPQENGNSTNNSTAPTTLVGNSNTGPLSDNSASYTSNETATFENANEAVITSVVDASANSGDNTSSANTGGGNIITGNTDVAVSDTTIANVNTTSEEETVWMIIVNEAGKWVGHILGSPWGATSASNSLPLAQTGSGDGTSSFTTLVENSATGQMSENNSSYSETSNTTITNDNKAAITNNITANSDSGNNDASFNTGAGVIDTGDATVGLNLVNMANTNVVAKKFVAILVNVLGGGFWGNIIPPNPSSPSSNNTSNPSGVYSGVGMTGSYISPTPTPTVYQLPASSDVPDNIGGGSDLTNNNSEVSNNQNQTIYYISDSYWQDYYNYLSIINSYPQQYKRAVKQVKQSQAKVTYQKQTLQITPTAVPKRGIFLSPAFAKATEGSFTGILLGGATLKVNQSWLSIIPVAIFIVLFRRRKKYNISKYLDAMLELIL